jgi:hypothetical protein
MVVVLIPPQKFADSIMVLSVLWMLKGVSLVAFSCTRPSDYGDTNVHLKAGRLDWLAAYAGRMQRHIMKILHNIHTKFHNKLSFASEVITGDSLIQ